MNLCAHCRARKWLVRYNYSLAEPRLTVNVIAYDSDSDIDISL
jgi:hypothetical protein